MLYALAFKADTLCLVSGYFLLNTFVLLSGTFGESI